MSNGRIAEKQFIDSFDEIKKILDTCEVVMEKETKTLKVKLLYDINKISLYRFTQQKIHYGHNEKYKPIFYIDKVQMNSIFKTKFATKTTYLRFKFNRRTYYINKDTGKMMWTYSKVEK